MKRSFDTSGCKWEQDIDSHNFEYIFMNTEKSITNRIVLGPAPANQWYCFRRGGATARKGTGRAPPGQKLEDNEILKEYQVGQFWFVENSNKPPDLARLSADIDSEVLITRSGA